MKINEWLRKDMFIITLMLILVPLAGELKFYPFDNMFRVSFGTPIFLFFLLLLRKIPPIVPGVFVAVLVLCLRMTLDLAVDGDYLFIESFKNRLPSSCYYFTYAILFQISKVNKFHHRPWLIGVFCVMIEIISSAAELLVQYIILGSSLFISSSNEIVIIAFFRSFFGVSLFVMIKLYEGQLREVQVNQKNQHLLMILSNLYEETVHLQKTLKDAENITKESYDLYRGLNQLKEQQGFSLQEFSQKALRLAGEIHEIKKDNQRIFAGLSKLISDERFSDYMSIDELIQLVIRINKKYAKLVKKEIQFLYEIKGQHPNYHVYLMLSMLNNLVANAVEAIEHKGTITVCVNRFQNMLEFEVQDTGIGIDEKFKELIFKPGFTLKYNENGTPSTGIGLFYVRQVVKELQGEIAVENHSPQRLTVFKVRLPISNVAQEGE
ncbi:sensor histidine kinase [Priestia megaterium]|nr:sensor histidine kinase [Priestia megaterium]